MKSMTCMVIGGPLDGRMETVPVHLQHIVFPITEPVSVIGMNAGITREIRTETYRKERIVGQSLGFTVLVWNGMSIDQALGMLVNGYARSERGG